MLHFRIGITSLFLLLMVISLLPDGGSLDSSLSAQEANLRDPFVLELPDIGNMRMTEAAINIPTADIHTIRFLVRRPFADLINYGAIHTKINGEAAATIQSIKDGREGHIVICDLDSKPRFRLHTGKNVVEINAIDRNRRPYYASYVLLANGVASNDSTQAIGAITESSAVDRGDDRQPPTITLIEPSTPVLATGAATVVRVHGLVVDNSGVVASVSVNGQIARLTPGAAGRGLRIRPDEISSASKIGVMTFDRTISIPSSGETIIVEARDRAGNTARAVIPVRRTEGIILPKYSGRKFAVVIGISRYKNNQGGLTNLSYADADARSVRDFLRRPEGGGFNPSNILYLENEQATIDAVGKAINLFLLKAGPDDLILFFLAGHGSPDPYSPQNLYFLMHDTRVADMPNTALPMTELQSALDSRVRAKRIIVFVDTCHSGGLSGEKLVATRGLENNLINLYASKLYNELGRAVLTSSDVNEPSQESEKWGGGHGVFTLALLDGLRGGADNNSDHLVTAGELFSYVRDRVRTETEYRQNPRALPGMNAELPLAFVTGK